MRNLKLFAVEIKNIKNPSSSPERFTEHIETILHNLARENKNIFILGDFNINLLNCGNHPASRIFSIGGFHAISRDTNNNGEMNKC